MDNRQNKKIRAECKDVWNAYMCKEAYYDDFNIPFCPTTAITPPNSIITWEKANNIYRKRMQARDKEFFVDAFVCWYIDDYKFDGEKGIWKNAKYVLRVLSHFAGAITPDFSTYQDFPEPIKIYNTYRMRVLGYWFGKNNIPVINNVRWGTSETYRYCFAGIPKNSMIAIGTCGGSPYKLVDRERFEAGLKELIEVLRPHTIIVYGSANYSCFKKIAKQGIKVISYPSQMSQVFEKEKKNE